MPDESNSGVSWKEFNQFKDKVGKETLEHDRRITALESLCGSLSELPATISNLDKTMALMGQNLENLNKEFEKFSESDRLQNRRIEEIDNKSRVDFLKWIKENWTTVVMFVSLLALIAKDYMK